jgi:hypothetical protein
MVTDLLIKTTTGEVAFEGYARAATPKSGPCSLVLFLARFLAAAFPSQRFFYPLPLAGLQVKRVTLYFLDDVLGLHLPFKPPQRVLEGFPLLKSNFRQRTTPPCSSNRTG